MDELEHQKSEDNYSVQTIILLAIAGYVVGVVLTIVWFVYFANAKTKDALDMSQWCFFVLLVLVILILSYSRNVRCIATLALPILCSSKGRSLVVAFAFVLAATGPTLNILRNVDVLTTSLSCGQMQLKQALGNMLDIMKQPLVALKEMIGTAMNEVRRVMVKVDLLLVRIHYLVTVLVASITNAFKWLNNIMSVCNKEFGTPFDRCIKIGNEAMENCRKKMGLIKGVCKVTKSFHMLCYSVKIIDVICVLVGYFNDAIIKRIMTELSRFKREIRNLFDVSVTFDHDFYFKTVASKELSEVGADIMADIHAKMRPMLMIFGYLDVVGSFLSCVIIIKALYFKIRYTHSPSYNNKYITKDFVEIDAVRQRHKQEVVLPLKSSERRKYVRLTDWHMTKTELGQVMRSMLFLTITCIQLFCICLADYSFYWLLAMISHFGQEQTETEVPSFMTVDVQGGGFVGDIFKGIVHAFEPLSMNQTLNVTSCLPVPSPPNFRRYYEIGALCFLAWLLVIFKPYGMRVRHAIMRWYYPEVAHDRAQWLYNDILKKRDGFFKFARRKARTKFLHDKHVDDFSFIDWLRAKTNRFCICRFLLGEPHGSHCIICSITLKTDKVVCPTPGCKGVYCKDCFKEGNNMCCICKHPLEYGDFSDLSEARDSSDEPDGVHVDETVELCSNVKNYSWRSGGE